MLPMVSSHLGFKSGSYFSKLLLAQEGDIIKLLIYIKNPANFDKRHKRGMHVLQLLS